MAEAILSRSSSGSGSSKGQFDQLITKIITENSTFIVPTNIIDNKISVRIFGGGGGVVNNSWTTIGSGGGNMNYGIINVTPNQSINVTIGKGGAVGGNGGTTSFGTYLSATGGTIGNAITGNGGNGGTGGGGGYCGNGFSSNITSSGHGGTGYYGGGGGGCGAMFINSGNLCRYAGNGGNGGIYGGGGGGGGGVSAWSNTIILKGGRRGYGGTYGGNGGSGCDYNNMNNISNAIAQNGTGTEVNSVYYSGKAGGISYNNENGTGWFWDDGGISFIGGAGGGGYGGKGGDAILGTTHQSHAKWTCGGGGGGGGGYCSNGCSYLTTAYAVGRCSTGGGGGGYLSDAKGSGGGGYGDYAWGACGSSSIQTYLNYENTGGNGICIIQYYV